MISVTVQSPPPILHAACLLSALSLSHSVDDIVVAMCRYTCAVTFGKPIHDTSIVSMSLSSYHLAHNAE